MEINYKYTNGQSEEKKNNGNYEIKQSIYKYTSLLWFYVNKIIFVRNQNNIRTIFIYLFIFDIHTKQNPCSRYILIRKNNNLINLRRFSLLLLIYWCLAQVKLQIIKRVICKEERSK